MGALVCYSKWCVSFDPCGEPCSHWLLRVAELGQKRSWRMVGKPETDQKPTLWRITVSQLTTSRWLATMSPTVPTCAFLSFGPAPVFRRRGDPSRTQLCDPADELHWNRFGEWEMDRPLS